MGHQRPRHGAGVGWVRHRAGAPQRRTRPDADRVHPLRRPRRRRLRPAARTPRRGEPQHRSPAASPHRRRRQAGRQVTPEPVPSGPAEVRKLAREFNEMTAARTGYEHQLTHGALHDPFTGLPNRALCLDRIGQALHAAEVAGQGSSPVVDLDRFKLVKPASGTAPSDQLLITASTRLSSLLRQADTLAWAGGDGFVLCRADDNDSRNDEGLATQVMAVLSEPLTVAGTDVDLHRVGRHRGHRSGRSGPTSSSATPTPPCTPRGKPRQQPVPARRRRPACPQQRPAVPGGRPAPCLRRGAAAPGLSAQGEPGQRPDHQRRGADALEPPDPRPSVADGVHPGRRGRPG